MLAFAGTVEAEDTRGEGLEHRADRGDIALRRAGDTRQRAGDRAGLATRDRQVEREAVLDTRRFGDIARQLGRTRGEIDQVGTGF